MSEFPSTKIGCRWRVGKTRYSDARTMDDVRWIKNRHGQWRKKEDTCTEADWIFRRKERITHRRGARLGPRFNH
jgi:hypothetical protein